MRWLLFALSVHYLTATAATLHVSVEGSDAAAGTAEAPMRTIQHAVDAVKPGDTVLIGPGVYRERIEVRNGGTAEAPVTLAAVSGAGVVITGADLLADGWDPVPGISGAFRHAWALRFPIGGPDDLTHPAGPEYALTGRAEQVMHAGRLLRQVLRREQLAPDTFFADLEQKQLAVWLRDGSAPDKTDLEASVRGEWLAAAPGVSHVRVRGLAFRYAANHAQRGAFKLGAGAQAWIIEDCRFERANGPGGTFTGSGHVIRRCLFQDNGQLGFGAWSCHDTRMEQCGIFRNNTRGYPTAWEAGGLKITLSRGFAILRCRAEDNRGPGIWYDIGNEQSEIAHCRIADNDEAGIFYEISWSLHAHDNLILNNANAGEKLRGAWGSGGITLSSSEDCLIENNTIAGNRDGLAFREQNRTTARIAGGDEVRILNKNHVVRNNIISRSRAFNVAFWMDTTFFGPHPAGHDRNDPVFADPATLNFRFGNNFLPALPGRPSWLYGPLWRPRHRTAATSEAFVRLSGIPDNSSMADPLFRDEAAHDYHLLPESPAAKAGAGVRGWELVPQP